MAYEIYEIAKENQNKWQEIFFVDVVKNLKENVVLERDFFENYNKNEVKISIGLGEPSLREKMYNKYSVLNYEFATLIHPKAWVSENANIGKGTIIFPFVYVAHNTTINENVLVHAHSNIENDCKIGNNSFLSSASFIGAKTKIGNNTFIGPNSTIRDCVEIGTNSIIGMGSVVTKDISDNEICVGNPCRKIGDNDKRKVFVTANVREE